MCTLGCAPSDAYRAPALTAQATVCDVSYREGRAHNVAPPCKINTVYAWRILQGGVCVCGQGFGFEELQLANFPNLAAYVDRSLSDTH